LDGCTEHQWCLLFCPASSFRSRISLADGTVNGPMISPRRELITAHHSVSSLSDPAREGWPNSGHLRPVRDVDTTCIVRRNVHEFLATKVRAHRAPNLRRGCVGRSHVDHTDARNDYVGCFGRSDRSAQRRSDSGQTVPPSRGKSCGKFLILGKQRGLRTAMSGPWPQGQE
jgi:hypothetical protein